VNTVEGRLGNTAEEAGRQGAGRGPTHVGAAGAEAVMSVCLCIVPED